MPHTPYRVTRAREIRSAVKSEAAVSLAAAFEGQAEWAALIGKYGYADVAREVNKIIDWLDHNTSIYFNTEQEEAS